MSNSEVLRDATEEPDTTRWKTVLAAARTTIPVFFGYLTIGTAFGFLLAKSGLAWWWAPVMSLTVYAGAAQFLSVGLFALFKSPWEMALAVLLVNARHMIYGISLLERYSYKGWVKAYLVFGLTDETYGLVTTVQPPKVKTKLFYLLITGLNQLYWVFGSVIGALAGEYISWDAPGISFSMTALFIVLLVEQIRSIRRPLPFVLAAAVCLVLTYAGAGKQALLLGILISSLGLFLVRNNHGRT